VYSPHVVGRTFICCQLIFDMLGHLSMWSLALHYGIQSSWLFWALAYNFVVHFFSWFWWLLHWRSLRDHMQLFQERRLPVWLALLELVSEQTDTALYTATAVFVGAKLPFATLSLFVWVASIVVAALHPSSGFKPFRRGPGPAATAVDGAAKRD
jgi:hypothetical protein